MANNKKFGEYETISLTEECSAILQLPPKLQDPSSFAIVMEEDDTVPIKLGRPFLATRKAQINVQEGELKLRIQGDEVTFHVFQAMKHPNDDPNDDILEFRHKEIMLGDLVNCKDMLSAVQKETKGVDGVGDNIFHPP